MPRLKADRPRVLEFSDYRDLIRCFIDHLKFHHEFSVRAFCQRAGIKSTSYLSMVLDGRRNLSKKSAQQFARGFQFSPTETQYFVKLVEWTHATSDLEKRDLFRDLIKIKKLRSDETILLKEYEYFSHWFLPILFVALQTPWKKRSPKSMATSLGISLDQLEEALETLKKLNLITTKDGEIFCKPFSLRTPREIRSLAIRNYHKQTLDRAKEALDRTPVDSREFGSLTLNLKVSDLSEVKRRIRKFREELSALFASNGDGEMIYQLNVQFFPSLSISEDSELRLPD